MDGRMVQRRRLRDEPPQKLNAGCRRGGWQAKANRRALGRKPPARCAKHGAGEQ